MPDRIQKFLRKLPEKQRRGIERLIERIVARETDSLDVQKIQGGHDIYRVRQGDLRIIYRLFDDEVFIIASERRSDNTYRKF